VEVCAHVCLPSWHAINFRRQTYSQEKEERKRNKEIKGERRGKVGLTCRFGPLNRIILNKVKIYVPEIAQTNIKTQFEARHCVIFSSKRALLR
jgi:hypothetical protein